MEGNELDKKLECLRLQIAGADMRKRNWRVMQKVKYNIQWRSNVIQTSKLK